MVTPIIHVKNVTVSFDGFKALDNLTFSMDQGELRVLVGPNGAGKSTLLDLVCGIVKPDAGEVWFKGRRIDGQREFKIARDGIGRKFQRPEVFGNMTLFENIEIAYQRKKNVGYTLFHTLTNTDLEQIYSILDLVGLLEKAHKKAGALSHGEKQWLMIGAVIVQDPDLMLLDEPVAGLSDQETEYTAELINSIATDQSILVIEHDMEFVRQIANKVTVLHAGSVLCEGSIGEVQNDPRVMEVYLGREHA